MHLGFLVALAVCSVFFCAPESLAKTEDSKSNSSKVVDLGNGALPSVCSDGNRLHLAFQKAGSIYYLSSSDTGATWSVPAKVSGNGSACSYASVASGNDGSVNIVWQDKSGQAEEEIFYTRSADGGKSWSNPINISNTPTQSSEPKLAIGNDNALHIVWIDALSGAKSPDLYYVVSKDGGKTWTERGDLSNTPGKCANPAIAVSANGTVHIAWLDESGGESHPDILYTYNAGGGFAKWQNISNSPRVSAHPSLACGSNNKVYLVWSDNSRKEKAADIWCVIGHDGKFRAPLNISTTPGISMHATIAADPHGRTAIAWSDSSDSPKAPNIWARTGHEGAFSNVMEIYQSDAQSDHPSVALTGKKAYVVWEERSGNSATIKGTAFDVSLAVGPAEGVDQMQYGHSR
jgi:hypothetical protein